LLTLGADNRL